MSDVKSTSKPDDGGKTATGATTGTGAEPASSRMPGAGSFDLSKSATADKSGGHADPHGHDAGSSEDRERNAVFGNLVTGDDDIVGLVAYSIYKQNKHDWLVSFNKAKDREPSEGEAYSYILGESTTRRLAIYRHLAQATLEGRGPQVGGGPATEKFAQHSFSNANSHKNRAQSGPGKTVFWIISLIAVVAALYIGAKFGMPGLPR